MSFGHFVSTSDIITFDQNWHHLYSRSAAGKDLSNDTQIGVSGSVKPEICTKMSRNLSEKLAAKFPASTLSYSMVKIARLNGAFSDILELEASPVEGQSLPQKDKKRRKRQSEKQLKRPGKPKNLQIFISAHARAKVSWNTVLVERKTCYHVAYAFLSRLEHGSYPG